jgi:proteasome lid subunit RPN8/RPN11
MVLILQEEAKKMIVEDAVKSYPYECCGFLYGSDDQRRIITRAEPVNNTREENKERRFEISATDYMKAEEYADNNNLTLLGVYHSHPDHPAIPSEYDLKRAMPYFSYIIASVKKGKISDIFSWRLNEKGNFDQEKIVNEQGLILNDLLKTK